MKQIVLLNLSPRGKAASSLKFLDTIKDFIEAQNNNQKIDTYSYRFVMNNENKCHELFAQLASCDDCVIAFPLYVDTAPAIAQHFMENYYQYFMENKPNKPHNLYTIVNCGFPEPEQNHVALEIINHFAKRTLFTNVYRLGIGMGTLLGDQSIDSKLCKNISEEFHFIAKSISQSILYCEARENTYVSANFGPLNRWKNKIYTFMGSGKFKSRAKENKVSDRLYDQPYKKYEENNYE